VTPADDARAFELVRVQGLSYSAAGKQFDPPAPKTTVRAAVTREAVRRSGIQKTGVASVEPRADAGFMARVLAAGPLPEPETELDDDLGLTDDAGDDLAVDVETMIRRQLKRIEAAIATATDGEAQKYTRTAAALASELRKYEREKRADDGIMTFTLADVEAVRADLRQKVRDTQARGLTCAECGRKLRRAEAEGGDDAT
jgi:hypothetical protein